MMDDKILVSRKLLSLIFINGDLLATRSESLLVDLDEQNKVRDSDDAAEIYQADAHVAASYSRLLSTSHKYRECAEQLKDEIAAAEKSPNVTDQLKRLEITEMFLNAVLGLAGITPADGDIDLGVVADAFRNKFITPEVQSAIDRDTPKKPLNQYKRYGKERGNCPGCNQSIDDQYAEKVCPSCGQRLDWYRIDSKE